MSKSVPPKDTRFPLAYLRVNFPSLSDVVEFSLELATQSSFVSMKISAPEMYPSTVTPSEFLYPSTVADAVVVLLLPVHVSVNVLSPGLEIVTISDPEVALDPDHAPDAEHEVAFVVDQVIVESFVNKTDIGSAEILTEGAGRTGALSPPPPPPPPPPQAEMSPSNEIVSNRLGINFLFKLSTDI